MPYRPPRRPLRIPAPFPATVGLGTLVKRATTAVGIRPCSGCQRRAERLNQLMVFGAKRSKP